MGNRSKPWIETNKKEQYQMNKCYQTYETMSYHAAAVFYFDPFKLAVARKNSIF